MDAAISPPASGSLLFFGAERHPVGAAAARLLADAGMAVAMPVGALPDPDGAAPDRLTALAPRADRPADLLVAVESIADLAHIEALGRRLADAAGTAPACLLLLLTTVGREAAPAGWFDRDAFTVGVRRLALTLAPAIRVNAIGSGDDPEALAATIRFTLGLPSITGQLLLLTGFSGPRRVGTARLARAAGPPARQAAAAPAALPGPGLRRMFVRDLVLTCRIGVYRHERFGGQRVRVSVDLGVREEPLADRLSDVVCYDRIVAAIRRIAAAEHVNLVETLAERIAAVCLEDPRVLIARVAVEKLDVYADAAGAGVEIERRRQNSLPNPHTAR